MGTKQFNNYEDLITFTRASGGHALRPVSYGDELIDNGTFDTDLSGWTDDNSQWAVSGSRAYHASSDVFGTLRQSLSVTTGNVYEITFDYEVTQGQLRCQARDSSNSPNSSFNINNLTGTGSASLIFVPDATFDSIAFARDDVGVASEMYVDNISVKEVLFDQPDGTLTLFEHPHNVPRVEWDADGNRLGLLVEESRTNLVTYSEDFSQSSWSKIRCSVSEGSITAPDGTASAFVVTPSTGLNTHYIADAVSGTSGSRTISFFAKKKEYSIVFVGHGIGAQEGTYFDLDAGAITSEGTDTDASTITPLPNGWYRCAITFDSVIDPRYAILAPCESSGSTSFNPDGSSGVYVWGAQFEAGSFPTSYIKSNSGSTTTRSADVASIPVADFGYNQSEGTVFVDFIGIDDSSVARIVAISDGTSNNAYGIQQVSGSTTSGRIQIGGTPLMFSNLPAITTGKAALVYSDEYAQYALNGSANSPDTTVATATMSILSIGNLNGSYSATGHIKSIKYYPRRLTNAQLQDLTS